MADPTIWLMLVVVAALAFDFINGFHDAANAIATSVATGVMSIRTAVIVSGVFNFAGALAGTAVASFIASGLVTDSSLVTQQVVFSALLGAAIWNLITWWYGIPSSSSHALIGGLAGAVVTHAGWNAFVWTKLVDKVIIPLVQSPLIGFVLAFAVMILAMWICRRMRPTRVMAGARVLQFLSACTLSFSHGMNDAQKVMGVITLALAAFMAGHQLKPLVVPAQGQSGETAQTVQVKYREQLKSDQDKVAFDVRLDPVAHDQQVQQAPKIPELVREYQREILPTAYIAEDKKANKLVEKNNVPFWVIVACATAMCLGTIAGGKKIIKTMGSKIIRMDPLQGFAAQTSGTAVIIGFSLAGTPLSTTHCISASIMGAGSSKGLAKVRWTVALNMVAAWIVTIPASGAMAALCQLAMERWVKG
jgi:phosphate/sulfate permease